MPPPITSPQNSRLKQVARLRDRRGRKQAGLFLVDGTCQLGRALMAGIVIREVYLPEGEAVESADRAVIEQARKAGAEILEVARAVFPKIAYGDRELGLVAVAETPSFELDKLALPADALVLVVEQIEKPGNLGAMLRTADAAGCQGALVADAVTDLTNPNVIRASMGALFTVPVAQAESGTIRSWLEQQDYRIFAARVDAATVYSAADFRGRVAIVLGSEAEGLSDIWQHEAVQAIRLPMLGAVDSLNVSVTAAVLLYEAQRQRGG